ncbi:MAG: hypothetical protein ABI406_05500 [Ktedonobacteraceae bacterium]
MKRTLRVVTLSMVIAVLAVFIMAFTVSAHTVSPYSSNAGQCSGVPTTSIVTGQKSGLAHYNPNSLKVHVSSTASLCIKNKTSVSQGVTYMGSVLATIPAGGKAVILCNSPNKATFSLSSNPKAVLNLNCKA